MKTTTRLLSALLLTAGMSAGAQAVTSMSRMACFNCMRSADLEGQPVIGMNGNVLGYILAVNERGRQVELQTSGGLALTLPESTLREFGGLVYAPNMSQRDVVALEKSQTGRTVAWNAGIGIGNFRG